MSAGNRAGDDPIAYGQGLTRRVHGDVLAHLHDDAAALVSQYHGNQTEGIVLVLVNVGTADSAAFYLHQHLIVGDLRDIELLDLNLAQSGQHRHTGFLGDLELRGRGGSRGALSGCSLHL